MIGHEEDNELFSVYWNDPDGGVHRERDYMPAKEAVELAHSLTVRPAAKLGVIREVKIIDRSDFTVFLWRNGEGVIYPTPYQRQQVSEMRNDH